MNCSCVCGGSHSAPESQGIRMSPEGGPLPDFSDAVDGVFLDADGKVKPSALFAGAFIVSVVVGLVAFAVKSK